MAVEEEKRGQYALAIQHFIASRDNDRVAKLTDNLMASYLQSGGLDLEDALASIPDHTLNNHVEFLRSYAKFHQDHKVCHIIVLFFIVHVIASTPLTHSLLFTWSSLWFTRVERRRP